MRDFQLRLFNFPVERLIKPRKRLSPVAVPDYLKKLIPFHETPLEQINDKTDIISFIDYFTFDLGFDNVADLQEYINSHEFFEFAKEINDTAVNAKVIQAISYVYASKRILQGLVADDSIFSYHIPYLAEASFDLECSITLIQEGYFKQSLQTLRNVIEVTLVHVFFALKDYDYEDLLAAKDIRMPTLKEMIVFFRPEKLLKGDFERQIFELYKDLSGAVHSEIRKLNTGRTTTGYESFIEWHGAFVKTAVFHLRCIIGMLEIGI